jgi:hypothetical protein
LISDVELRAWMEEFQTSRPGTQAAKETQEGVL